MDQSQSVGKRLWHIVRIAYYMFRKGISKHKLMMDLHLLLKRGKIAGKALGNLMTSYGHHQHHHHSHYHASDMNSMYSGFSCRSMEPNMAFYSPKEVQFSCSNTPLYSSFGGTKRKNRRRGGGGRLDYYYDEDITAVAKAFDLLNSEMADEETMVAASPSPAPFWYGKSPAKVRQLRVTDSPFPIREEEVEVDGHVDQQAEEFIRRFYEQLRIQQRIPETPESWYYRRESLKGRA